MNKAQIIEELRKLQNPQKAIGPSRVFKTGKGEYGEGDVFWGINVPNQRLIAKKYSIIDLRDVLKLLKSNVHEQRQTALFILVIKFHKGDQKLKESIYNLYLANTKYINNWDLVDLSAPNIIGEYLINQNKRKLTTFARSISLWERRMAIVATYAFIRNNVFDETLKIAEILLQDQHDLIHKAVGWMLREVGKRNRKVEEQFLKKHCRRMPRVMLRYAIERFDEKTRLVYLTG